MSDARKALILLGCIALAFICLSGWSCANAHGAEKARAEATRLAAINLGLETAARIAKQDAAALAEHSKALEDEVVRLRAQRRPKPAPAAPAPEKDEELAAALSSKGLLAGLTVQMGVSSTLVPEDAKKVYSWASEAERVPGFETKSATDDAMIAAQDQLVSSVRAEIVKAKEVVILREKQLETISQRSEALQKENEHLVSVQVAEKWKTKIKIGGALAIGGGIVYMIRK
ncbi:MAG: hypothetical protein KGN80_00005 [Acidobacteriota bacterium]|nr:hypothetical protein [Acidobacteriota bacterium]